MNNPETYVLTHNRFSSHLVLIFSDVNKAQKSKMPYRDSPHRKIEILMSFENRDVFNPNEHREDSHIRKPNIENFVFELEIKNIFICEKKYLLSEQMML